MGSLLIEIPAWLAGSNHLLFNTAQIWWFTRGAQNLRLTKSRPCNLKHTAVNSLGLTFQVRFPFAHIVPGSDVNMYRKIKRFPTLTKVFHISPVNATSKSTDAMTMPMRTNLPMMAWWQWAATLDELSNARAPRGLFPTGAVQLLFSNFARIVLLPSFEPLP